MRPPALARRVELITAHAEAHDWLVVTEDADVDGSPAVLLGFARNDQHPDDPEVIVPWSALMALVITDAGRVGTLLDSERHDARFVLELDALGRYWWTTRADGWRAALADPWAWVDKAPTAMELRLAPILDRIDNNRRPR